MIYDAAIIGLGTMGTFHASSSRVAGGVSSASIGSHLRTTGAATPAQQEFFAQPTPSILIMCL